MTAKNERGPAFLGLGAWGRSHAGRAFARGPPGQPNPGAPVPCSDQDGRCRGERPKAPAASAGCLPTCAPSGRAAGRPRKRYKRSATAARPRPARPPSACRKPGTPCGRKKALPLDLPCNRNSNSAHSADSSGCGKFFSAAPRPGPRGQGRPVHPASSAELATRYYAKGVTSRSGPAERPLPVPRTTPAASIFSGPGEA